MKIKILHVIPTLGAGGAEKLMDELLPKLDNEKFNIDLLVLSDQNLFFSENLEANEHIKLIFGPGKKIKSFSNFWYLLKLVHKEKYDIIHSHLFPTLYWVSLLSIIMKKTFFVHTEHNTHNRRRDIKSLRFLEKRVYKQFDKIISISEETQNNLLKWINLNLNDKFVVVYNGINVENFITAKSYPKERLIKEAKEDSFLVGMVGSLSKQKDQATIIKAMKNLNNEIYLIIIGDGERKAELKDLVRELKLDKRVKFLGVRRDVSNIMKTLDVNIVSSNWEGFGLVAAEGFASGKPVIASDISGLKEVVSSSKLRFQKNNFEELTSLISKLYNDEKFYNDAKEISVQRTHYFSIDKMVSKYEKIYYNLISR